MLPGISPHPAVHRLREGHLEGSRSFDGYEPIGLRETEADRSTKGGADSVPVRSGGTSLRPLVHRADVARVVGIRARRLRFRLLPQGEGRVHLQQFGDHRPVRHEVGDDVVRDDDEDAVAAVLVPQQDRTAGTTGLRQPKRLADDVGNESAKVFRRRE